MPISVTCPECNSAYRVADDAAGKAIKCKKCGARVPVPATADDDLSALNTGGRTDGEADAGAEGGGAKPAKKAGSGKIIAIVAAALVGACCICTGIGGGIGYYVYNAGRDVVNKVQQDLAKIQKDQKAGGGGNVILEKTDTLTQKAPKTKEGKSALSYKVKLEAGKQYTIDMKADHPAMGVQDPYLILLDPKGGIVAQDDDSGGNFNAQIRITPPTTGEYTIQATTFGNSPPGGMPFRLTVRQQ